MKLTRCSLDQFGTLTDKKFDLADGFHLIRGSRGSGRTFHAALSALLFGSGKEAGRGAIEWERDGRTFRVERDLTRTPPRAAAWEKTEAGLQDISAADLPLPPSLSPHTYFNTLTIRLPGAGTAGSTAGEYRRRILSLQSCGNEDIVLGTALADLKEKRRVLRKQLQPEAAARMAAVRRGLAEAQQADFSDAAEDWNDEKERLADQEARARRLAEERSHMTRELQARQALLKERSLDDPETVKKDLETASVLAGSLANFEECYADSRFFPGAVKLISYLSLPVMLLFFWLVVNSFQTQRYVGAALASVGFFLALLASLRFSRKQDALTAQEKNRKILLGLLEKYMPSHEAAGTAQEAAELQEYLTKVSETFTYLEDREAVLQDKTEELSRILGDNEAISRNLEENLTRRLARERWEDNVRKLREEEAALKPVLEKNQALEEEIAALDLAVETLADLSVRTAADPGAALTDAASRIFREITGGRYRGVRITGDQQLLAEQDGDLLPPEALSAVTLAQLYLSFRLAMIRLLWPDEPMPLFLDGSLASCGGECLASLVSWLRGSYRGQVFLFSCPEDEETVPRDPEIPFRKITLE